MRRTNIRRIVLVPTALSCIIIAFLSLATAIDFLRTLVILQWTGFLPAILVILILALSVSALVVVFGLYYWLEATFSELHMWYRATLSGVVFFPLMVLASIGKIVRFLALEGLGFWQVGQLIGPYSHIGVFGGAAGFAGSLVAFLLLRRQLRREIPSFGRRKRGNGKQNSPKPNSPEQHPSRQLSS